MEPDTQADDQPKHPVGTVAVVVTYGILMILGWLAVYIFAYLPRGIVTR